MMQNVKFSVSMCVYGGDDPNWFETAVESILDQTVPPTEVVLVVDGPVPNETDAVIKKYEANSIFNIIRFKENQGHGNARRAGLSACTNELVALMDADDISVSDRFEKQLAAFEKDAELDIVGGNISEFICSADNIVAKREVPASDSDIKDYMKKRCPMNQMTVMFKKASVENVGGYIDWYCDEDYYLWLRMALADMKFFNISDTLVNVRVGEDMYRRRGGKRYFQSEARLQKFMLEKKIINRSTYASNVTKRFIVQVLLPNKLRGVVFKKFARKKV
ncbi:MAG: glycosyltransferase [Clostridia bacterium]|nr:glycosyltransferase [Clostridia bacterium]